MKSLLLMRHSYAVSNNPAYSDRERPLTDNGRKIARDTAALLENFHVDRIICSSAVRTVETAEIVASVAKATVHKSPSLYLARAAEYRDAAVDLADDEDDTVLVVGHNPGIASLIMSWSNASLSIVPCTVAMFKINIDHWSDLPTATPELSGFISEGKQQTLR